MKYKVISLVAGIILMMTLSTVGCIYPKKNTVANTSTISTITQIPQQNVSITNTDALDDEQLDIIKKSCRGAKIQFNTLIEYPEIKHLQHPIGYVNTIIDDASKQGLLDKQNALIDKINSMVVAYVKQKLLLQWKESSKQLVENATDISSIDFSNNFDGLGQTTHYETVFNQGGLLSLRIFNNIYENANPTMDMMVINFDFNNLKEINLKDLFIENSKYMEKLNELPSLNKSVKKTAKINSTTWFNFDNNYIYFYVDDSNLYNCSYLFLLDLKDIMRPEMINSLERVKRYSNKPNYNNSESEKLSDNTKLNEEVKAFTDPIMNNLVIKHDYKSVYESFDPDTKNKYFSDDPSKAIEILKGFVGELGVAKSFQFTNKGVNSRNSYIINSYVVKYEKEDGNFKEEYFELYVKVSKDQYTLIGMENKQ